MVFNFLSLYQTPFFKGNLIQKNFRTLKKINNNKKDNDRADQVEARVEGLSLLSQLHHFSFFFSESFLDYYLLLILNR